MMLPSTQNRYGDLLKEFYDGLKNGNLPENRMDVIRRVFNELSDRDEKIKGLFQDQSVKLPNVRAKMGLFDILPNRGVSYTGGSPATINNNTYTDISFSTMRGRTDSPEYELLACVQRVAGSNSKFTKAPFVYPKQLIVFMGDFSFDTNTTGSREVFIEYFDKADVSQGGYTFAAKAASSDWTTISFIFMDWFNEGDYVKFEVWQDSGIGLALQSANFSFMLV